MESQRKSLKQIIEQEEKIFKKREGKAKQRQHERVEKVITDY